MSEIKKASSSLHTTFYCTMASGKKYEAPVYLGLVKMETIITQDSGMCLLVYRQTWPRTSKPLHRYSSGSDAVAKNSLPTEAAKGVDSHGTASLSNEWMGVN